MIAALATWLVAAAALFSSEGARADSETAYSTDFSAGAGAEWSPPQTETSPGGERHLGLFDEEDSATLSLSGLPSHKELVVELDVYILDSMDGNDTGPGSSEEDGFPPHPDIFRFSADGTLLKQTTFGNRHPQAFPGDYPGDSYPPKTGATAIDSLGYDEDTTFHVSLTFAHSGANLAFTVASSGLEDISDESWGIDNVSVRLEPQSCGSQFKPGPGGEEIVGDDGENTLVGTPNDDVICGLGSRDRIEGGGGNDIILGGSGPDVIKGNEGNDRVFGNGGDDRFIDYEGPERDVYNGGTGKDGLYYTLKSSGVVARIGGRGGQRGERDRILNSVENLFGTAFNDRLYGNNSQNKLAGRDGEDRLFGRGKKDRLLGQDGVDRLGGGSGNDVLLGGPDGDLLSGDTGNDTLLGGPGEDDLLGGRGRDRFFGEQGDDTLLARDHRIDRVLSGGPGTDLGSFDPAEEAKVRSVEQR